MPYQYLDLKVPIEIESITAIDIGCAEGWTSIELTQKKARVFSVDLSEELLQVARKNFHLHLSSHPAPCLIRGTCTALPFKNDVSNLAICTEVIEHTTEPAMLLSELHRILAPGGYCILSFPVRWVENVISLFSSNFLSFSGHVKQFSLKEMRTLSLAANLKTVSIQRHYFEWSLFWLLRSILQQIPKIDRRGVSFGQKGSFSRWDKFSSFYGYFWRRVNSYPLGKIFIRLANLVCPKSYFLLLQKI